MFIMFKLTLEAIIYICKILHIYKLNTAIAYIVILIGVLIPIFLLTYANHLDLFQLKKKMEIESISFNENFIANYERPRIKILNKLVSQCDNGKDYQCFASVWKVYIANKGERKGKVYYLRQCRYMKSKSGRIIPSCIGIDLSGRYDLNLHISRRLLKYIRYNENTKCSYIYKEDILNIGEDNHLKYLKRLNINPNVFTYCFKPEPEESTKDELLLMLTQRQDHNPVKKEKFSEVGCTDPRCLEEASAAYNKLLNTYKKKNEQ